MTVMPFPDLDARPRPRSAMLPDVTLRPQPVQARGRIDRVGMERIDLPVRVRGECGRLLTVPAEADVKREDEHAFAALNGSNLMFCEDAARTVKSTLDEDLRVIDFRVKIRHEESLHPHDAVAVITKGVPGGLTA